MTVTSTSQYMSDAEKRMHSEKCFKNLMDLMHASNKIEAIKALRSLTGHGLKESKDFIEDHWSPFTEGINQNGALHDDTSVLLEESQLEDINRRLRNLEAAVENINGSKKADIKQMATGLFGEES